MSSPKQAAIWIGVSLAAAGVAGFVMMRGADKRQGLGAYGGARSFDLVAFLPEATRLARATHPDAELVSMEVNRLGADGRADLSGPAKPSYANLRFRSLAKSWRPDGGAWNVELPCIVNVWVAAEGVDVKTSTTSARDCPIPIVAPPRCTIAEAWRRANAPAGVQGSVTYEAAVFQDWFTARQKVGYKPPFDVDKQGAGVWKVSLRYPNEKTPTVTRVPDDC